MGEFPGSLKIISGDHAGSSELVGFSGRIREFEPKRHIVRDGDPLMKFPLMVAGWAARYQILRDGSRQIIGLLLPGDLCYFNADPATHSSQDIVSLSRAVVAIIDHSELNELAKQSPAIDAALKRYANYESSLLSTHIVSLGRRNALERTSHLICEIRVRLEAVRLVEDNTFDFPLTQDDLADLLGLTPVHTNRKLQELRRAGLIVLQARQMTILDVARLERLAGFDADYLHPKVAGLTD